MRSPDGLAPALALADGDIREIVTDAHGGFAFGDVPVMDGINHPSDR